MRFIVPVEYASIKPFAWTINPGGNILQQDPAEKNPSKTTDAGQHLSDSVNDAHPWPVASCGVLPLVDTGICGPDVRTSVPGTGYAWVIDNEKLFSPVSEFIGQAFEVRGCE
jgi:hypothetical protein